MANRFAEIVSGCDSNELADYLGVSTQAVSQFKNGKTTPKLENILKIAKFCNVSLDYLFGVSNIKSTNITLQQVGQTTGLSERAVRTLLELTEHEVGVVSKIIEVFRHDPSTGD